MIEREIFLAALEIEDPAARQAHVQSACAGDLAPLARVESLLTLNDSQSQFLETPVVDQIASDSSKGCLPTILLGSGSTQDEEPDSADFPSNGPAPITTNLDDDDETPLEYLEPSSKPGSIGRLAHYEILHVLGRGAFGTVLKAFDEKLQRVVAIKVLAPEMAATSPARKRFLREARASAAIRHEHVVAIHAVEEQPLPYLVMEFIPGQTMQQRLDDTGPLAVPDVLQLGRQIAEGLAAAHAKDLIHRDIKPGNILLEEGVHERVKITDFGLAHEADDASVTQSGLIAGTPMYMAPEQALGRKLDQRADLFSLGSVLYQMVSGRPPFRAPSTLAVLKRVTEEMPRPMNEIIPETPEWLGRIITKLHAKNPDERFQTAREVADVLADCETQLKANARLQDFSRIPREKPVTSSPWKWVAAVAALLIPMLALSVTESTGVTHLFRGQQATNNPVDASREPTTVQGDSDATPNADGWVKLFNGKDLTGWKFHPNHPGTWEVKDGVLKGSARQSHLFSERGDYGDFHLRAEVKINLGGDSGILFRAPLELRRGRAPREYGVPGCYEAELQEIRSPLRPTGSISEATGDAAPIILGKVIENSLTQPDEWFAYEVIATGNHFITKINGVETARCKDPLDKHHTGHLALQVWNPNTLVQFRKIEIKELPSSGSIPSDLASRRFGSDEWIDVIPLIDPQADRWDVPQKTGKNSWRKEQGTLVVGGDTLASKLLLPLDSDWPAFECELEFTRLIGTSGLNLNIPTKQGECPLVVDPQGGAGVHLGSTAKGVRLTAAAQLVTGQRTTMRVEVRRQLNADHVSVLFNGASVGEWTGDRNAIAYAYKEGFPHDRRVSLWIQPGGNEIVFQRIRVRMLDGGTAETLRPVSGTPALGAPATAGSKLIKLRSFTPGKDRLPVPLRPEGKEVVTVDGDAWRIENSGQGGNFNIMIAQVIDDIPQDGVLVFRAKVRVQAKHKLASGNLGFGGANHLFLSWDQWPDALTRYDGQDSQWVEKEVRHPVAECRKTDPPAIHLYAGLHADGVVWLKDVELLHLPAVKTATQEPQPTAVAADVLKNAVLLMDFEQDTFYEKDGKTYVRDLSGNGNDGTCEMVEFTSTGKVGGGLSCKSGLHLAKSLVNRQPNYTIALWGRADNIGTRPYSTARSADLTQLVFKIALSPERNVLVNAWNRAKLPGNWIAATTSRNVMPKGEWYFLAVTLSGGGVETGEVRVTFNDTVNLLSSQMVETDRVDGLIDLLGQEMTGVLDEVAVFQRALTDQEIAAVRALGLNGTPLSVGKAPPAAVQALRELVIAKEGERDQAKQSFRDGLLSKLDLLYAEIDAIDARIQLTQAEQNAVANIAAYRSLVAFREQERELIAEKVKAGSLKQADLERADSSLSDAKGRLSKAIEFK